MKIFPMGVLIVVTWVSKTVERAGGFPAWDVMIPRSPMGSCAGYTPQKQEAWARPR